MVLNHYNDLTTAIQNAKPRTIFPQLSQKTKPAEAGIDKPHLAK